MSIFVSLFGKSKRDKAPTIDVARVLRQTTKPSAPHGNAAPSAVPSQVYAALETINRSFTFLAKLREHIITMASLTHKAMAESDLGQRALYAEQFEDYRAELPTIVAPLANEPVHLLSPNAQFLTITLPQGGEYIVSPINIDPNEGILSMPLPDGAFTEMAEINRIITALEGAVTKLDRATATFQADIRFLEQRTD